MGFHVVASVLFLSVVSKGIYTENPASPTIAIVGGGIGGASTAHFLRELFGDDADVDLYEAKEIGGRLAQVEVDGRAYEAGATLIHPDNFYMTNLTKFLGLEPRSTAGGRLGLYGENGMFFTGSEWDYMLMAQLLWRYGWDIYRVLDYVENMLHHFNRIYSHQDSGYSFTTVEGLLSSMSPHFVDMLHHSCADDLKGYGFGETFVNELVQGAQRSNYGQNIHLQAFVGSVCLAGVMPGLWKVKGGNKQVPEGLVNTSRANVIRSKVTSITKVRARYRIVATGVQEIRQRDYDFVILATPLTTDISQIDFTNIVLPSSLSGKRYHRTVATFIKAWPNITNFGFDNFNDFPTEILTTDDDIFFNSISRQTALDFQPGEEPQIKDAPVWKVFSKESLTDAQIRYLFSNVKEKQVADWLAYPHYASSEKDLPPFKLDERLYYLNAIEWAASAMEMELIGAKNIALLAFNEWHGLNDKIDERNIDNDETKTEL